MNPLVSAPQPEETPSLSQTSPAGLESSPLQGEMPALGGGMDQAMALYLFSMGSSLDPSTCPGFPGAEMDMPPASSSLDSPSAPSTSESSMSNLGLDPQSFLLHTDSDGSPSSSIDSQPCDPPPPVALDLPSFGALPTPPSLPMTPDGECASAEATAAWLQNMMLQYQQGDKSVFPNMPAATLAPSSVASTNSTFSSWGETSPAALAATAQTFVPPAPNAAPTLTPQQLALLVQASAGAQLNQTPAASLTSPPRFAPSTDMSGGKPVRRRASRAKTAGGANSTQQAAGGAFATAVRDRLAKQRASPSNSIPQIPPALLASIAANNPVVMGLPFLAQQAQQPTQQDHAEPTVPFNKKSMSETSLAHKLRITSQAKPASSDNKDDAPATALGVLKPGQFDTAASAIGKVRQVASEREARWAKEPLPAPGSKVEQAREAARAQAAQEGRAFEEDLNPYDPEEKEPHNAIERRYRNNINDRIAILRNAVPALREVRPVGEQGGRRKRGSRAKNKPAQVVDGISLATKLNKATILTKSTEYIYYLKRRETDLLLEIEGYKELVRSFERGEELLEIWLQEMECIKKERDAEKAAITPQAKKTSQDASDEANSAGDAYLDLEPLPESMDEEMDSAVSSPQATSVPVTASSSSTGSAGMYMMAAFLGVTWVDNRVWQAPSPSSPEDLSFFQTMLSCVRVWLGIACTIVLFVPFWMRGLSNLRQTYFTPRSAPSERTARAVLLSKLATPRTAAADTDAALRAYLGAPSSSLAAVGGAIQEFFLLALPDRCLTALFPPSTAPTTDAAEGDGTVVDADGSEMSSHAWLRLLELETSVGPFAVPALSLRVHTILSTLRRARLHRLSTNPLSTLRIEATAALALGRMAKTEHTFGRWLRGIASERWDELRVLVAQASSHASHTPDSLPSWLKPVLALDLDTALAMVPSRTSLASTTAAAPAATGAYLATPLLVMSSKMHMATLQRIWTYLFAALVHAPAPRTLSWRTDWDVVEDGFEGDDAWDLEGGVSLRAFLTEYGNHVGASAGPLPGAKTDPGAFLRPLSLSVLENAKERAAMEDMVSEVQAATAPGTPAHLAARLTRIAWTFLSSPKAVAQAQEQVLTLVADLALVPPACPTATLAVEACARLVLGQKAGDEVTAFLASRGYDKTAAEEQAYSDDARVFALMRATLGWAGLLRGLAGALADSHGDADTVLFPSSDSEGNFSLLAPTLELRRVLAHTMAGEGAEAHSCGPARDTCIDVLTHLCYLWTCPAVLAPLPPPAASDEDSASTRGSCAEDSLADSSIASPSVSESDWDDEEMDAMAADVEVEDVDEDADAGRACSVSYLDGADCAWEVSSQEPRPVLAGYTPVMDLAVA